MCLCAYRHLSSIFDNNFKQTVGPTTIEQIICSSNSCSCNEDAATDQETMANGDAMANGGSTTDKAAFYSMMQTSNSVPQAVGTFTLEHFVSVCQPAGTYYQYSRLLQAVLNLNKYHCFDRFVDSVSCLLVFSLN